MNRVLRWAGRWRSGLLTLLTAATALLASLALLLVPLTGGVGYLLDLSGDTPAMPGPPADQLTGGFIWVRSVEITAAAPSGGVESDSQDAGGKGDGHPGGINRSRGSGIWSHIPVGGISGIDCDVSGCLAISDDPGQRGPVRVYPLDPETGQVGRPMVLTDAHGVPYRSGTVDPESIRLIHRDAAGAASGMVWSAEGTPTVTIADAEGRARRTLPVPPGVRRNQGLEGLAVLGAEDEGLIITATEAAPRGEDHPRITVYDSRNPGGNSSHQYRGSNLPSQASGLEDSSSLDGSRGSSGVGDMNGDMRVASYQWSGTGVSEILGASGCAADGLGLFVLERGYTPGVGNSAVLWRTELPGVTGPHESTGQSGSPGPMLSREPVLDLAALLGADQVGNVESLALWPRPDGTCELLVGTDNNFRASQRSVIHVLRPTSAGAGGAASGSRGPDAMAG